MKELGPRLKLLREDCGFTIEEIAADLGISRETYSAYEESGADVPISVLYHMSTVCKIDLNELLTGNAAHIVTLAVTRRGKGQRVDRYPGYNFENLAFTFKNKIMEPLLVTIEPESGDPRPVSHGGQEFNMVLEGEIELIFGDKRVRLLPGDSVYFDPERPHGQRAVGVKSRFLTVITE